MQLHNLKQSKGIKEKRRVGRGGAHGKTSGKGMKGQKSRAGHKIRPAERDIIKRIPKRRGYGKNRARTVNSSRIRPQTVNLKDIESLYAVGERVDPKTLAAKKLIRRSAGRLPAVKVLGTGALTKKVTVAACEYSEKAKEAILAAGGEVL